MFSLTSFLGFASGFSNSFLVIAVTDWGLAKASAREFSSRWGGDLETTGSTGAFEYYMPYFRKQNIGFFRATLCAIQHVSQFLRPCSWPIFCCFGVVLNFSFLFCLSYSFNKYFIGKEHTKLNISNIDTYDKKMIQYFFKKKDKKKLMPKRTGTNGTPKPKQGAQPR